MREQRLITNFYAGYSSVYYSMQYVHEQSSSTYHIPYQLHSQQFWIALWLWVTFALETFDIYFVFSQLETIHRGLKSIIEQFKYIKCNLFQQCLSNFIMLNCFAVASYTSGAQSHPHSADNTKGLYYYSCSSCIVLAVIRAWFHILSLRAAADFTVLLAAPILRQLPKTMLSMWAGSLIPPTATCQQ